MKSRRGAKEDAAELVKFLTESAVSLSHTNLPLAREQAALARRVRLRFNVRPDSSLKGFTCRGCKGLIVPGVNARVRLGHGKPTVLRITCADCGHVNRKIIGETYIASEGARKSTS
ncbi:MAG TPA: RNase P subunit [Nitrososphaerales archaeon]|nr:RNase P subunit [Nitrososphaerales archaeon]